MAMTTVMRMLKAYLLYFVWASWRRSAISRVVQVPIAFFSPWLTLLEMGNERVLVVEQPTLTTLVVIPYSFLSLVLLPEHPKVHAWLHRICSTMQTSSS